MEWKIDGTARKKALKFKEDYERLFQEMTGSMESLAGEVVGCLKQENLWDDQEAVLNVISVLPGCWFRSRLYSRYYEIADKPHKVVTNPECKVWKADREILRKAQDFAEDYEEKEKRLLQMEEDADKELTDYTHGRQHSRHSTMRRKRQAARKGRKLHGTPTMSWRSRSRQREVPTQEFNGFTARHGSGATSTLI